MVVGVVSDTHGRIHPGTLEALAGVSRIGHAGDVGDGPILERLAAIAPVTAVRGNVDRSGAASRLPSTEVLEAAGALLYVLHDVGQLDLDPVSAGFAAVISGHTHVPMIERRRDVLFLNPGSCGPRRFDLPLGLARLTIEAGRVSAELITLVPGKRP